MVIPLHSLLALPADARNPPGGAGPEAGRLEAKVDRLVAVAILYPPNPSAGTKVQVHPAGLPLDLVDLALAVVLVNPAQR